MPRKRTITTAKFLRMLDRYGEACAREVAEGVRGTSEGVEQAKKDKARFRLRLCEWAVEAITVEE